MEILAYAAIVLVALLAVIVIAVVLGGLVEPTCRFCEIPLVEPGEREVGVCISCQCAESKNIGDGRDGYPSQSPLST